MKPESSEMQGESFALAAPNVAERECCWKLVALSELIDVESLRWIARNR
jgi:hypothetical protein